MEDDVLFINEAINEAMIAYSKGEVPVGCVIVVDGKIIARGHNQREAKNSVLAHAEIIAIEEASKKLNRWILDDATIYITLEPCLMCAGAIFQARMKRVVYGASEPKFGGLGSLININEIQEINHKLEITSGVKADYIAGIMKNFFIELRK
ncbi:MAG: nucleoside deaminase [Bacilli bacterium]